ncbi:citrate/2-methylcitrate synthase [Rathayibacter sp. CAU 1779]
MDAALPRLTAAQTASRLGVKPQTLYAYVSRGLLSRERDAHGSSFDPLEVEAFASSRRAGPVRPSDVTAPGSPLMVMDTDIALIEDGELYFRGIPAAELAVGHAYEDVARWVWMPAPEASAASAASDALDALDAPGSGARFAADPDAVHAARAAVASLPADATALDRIQVAVPVLGAFDPTRHDLGADAVRAAAERLIGGIVETLVATPSPRTPTPVRTLAPDGSAPASQDNTPDRPSAPLSRTAGVWRSDPQPATAEPGASDAGASTGRSIAEVLWRAFTGRQATETEARVLNAALVLLVDHDLAVSTLAARAAASARATPYAVVSSGLGALDSALHGNASGAASDLIGLVLDGADARTALSRTLARTARPAPGFGQPLYPGIDARARILLPLVAELDDGQRVIDAVDRLAEEVRERTGRHPNVDLALAALTTAAGMPADSGAAIFAVARSAGWIAHAIDEYGQRPLRMRPTGRYVGAAATAG